MVPGGKYYIQVSPYSHYVAECVEVYGPRSARFTNVVFVYSSQRDWTAFFKDGFAKSGDVFKHKTDGDLHGWTECFDWPHPIPEKPKGWPK